MAEIDPFACAVLAARHPNVRNLGDITKITEMDIVSLGSVDLVIFGSPCQDLSIAGKQKGLAGERSGLFFPAIDIITWSRLWCGTRFALWENVPGALSSNKGRDFAAVVDSLAGLDGTAVPPKGWGTEGCAVGTEAMVEWSTLDAQWFGVAQRRRRVFALADFGDWAGRQPILLEPKGVRGDSPPSREAGQNPAGSLTGGARQRGGYSHDDTPLVETVATLDASFGRLQGASGQDANHGHSHLVPTAYGGNNQSGAIDVATARNACASASGRLDFETETFLVQPAHTLRGEGFDASEDGTGRGTPLIPVAFDTTQITSPANVSNPKPGDPCHPLAAGAHAPTIAFPARMSATVGAQVRRLTPAECERLQGFPDGYTAIPWRGKTAEACPGGPRYKTLGNSMAVPVIRWIGQRIETALLFAS